MSLRARVKDFFSEIKAFIKKCRESVYKFDGKISKENLMKLFFYAGEPKGFPELEKALKTTIEYFLVPVTIRQLCEIAEVRFKKLEAAA